MSFTIRAMKNGEYTERTWKEMVKSGRGCLYAVVNQHDVVIHKHLLRDVASDIAQEMNEELESEEIE